MVRLKVHGLCYHGFKSSFFQFQYGTIKSAPEDSVAIIDLSFQFQYGTIKRNKKRDISPEEMAFNSSMVRLKEYFVELNPHTRVAFDKST